MLRILVFESAPPLELDRRGLVSLLCMQYNFCEKSLLIELHWPGAIICEFDNLQSLSGGDRNSGHLQRQNSDPNSGIMACVERVLLISKSAAGGKTGTQDTGEANEHQQ